MKILLSVINGFGKMILWVLKIGFIMVCTIIGAILGAIIAVV
jgi:hypothetical protein